MQFCRNQVKHEEHQGHKEDLKLVVLDHTVVRQRPYHHFFLVLFVSLCFYLSGSSIQSDDKLPRVAVITTVWRHNSHADVLGSRLVQGYTLDSQGDLPKLKLVSAYVDQFPDNDMSRSLAREHGFTIYDSVASALTLGTDKLSVDGVLLICEHGDYPKSETGSIQYPKRRLFGEIIKVFEKAGRVVPVFSDKHLEDDWNDIAWFYGEAQRLKIPLMAGSSLPTTWRHPQADVERDQPLREIVAIGYGPLDAYGFHALEMVQCLAERRKGGETGIKTVRYLTGNAVWQAAEEKLFDRSLLDAAVARFREKPLPAGTKIEDVAKNPSLFVIDHADGLRASIFMADRFVDDFTVAWRYADGHSESTCFWLQDGRPYMHFSYLLKGVEQMTRTGQPTWPVERALLTSGLLDAALQSHHKSGAIIDTPYLNITYKSNWIWQTPPPPPPTRPTAGQ
jgi:hypothetical protein